MPGSGKFLSLGDKRKSNGTHHTKDFCEENGLKSLDFKDSSSSS
jgi:hypothetical protein